MICPNCSGKIGLFSKAINGWGQKSCPHCDAAIAIGINWKRFSLLLVPIGVAYAFVTTFVRIYFDLGIGVILGAACGATLIALTMMIKPDEAR